MSPDYAKFGAMAAGALEYAVEHDSGIDALVASLLSLAAQCGIELPEPVGR